MQIANRPCRRSASSLWLVYLTWTTYSFRSRYVRQAEETARQTPAPKGSNRDHPLTRGDQTCC